MLTERAERYADEAIDALADRRSAEFVTDLAVPVPLRIIADMLGVADGDLEQFREWSDAMIVAGGGHSDDGTLADTQQKMGDFLVYLTDAVERRRAHPSDDVLSRIIEAADAGVLDNAQRLHRLEGDEVRDFALFLLVAGNETTRNGISQGMLALFEHPCVRPRSRRPRLDAASKRPEAEARREQERWEARDHLKCRCRRSGRSHPSGGGAAPRRRSRS